MTHYIMWDNKGDIQSVLGTQDNEFTLVIYTDKYN